MSCRGGRCNRCLGLQWQGDAKTGSGAHLGVKRDAAAVQVHRFLDDGEAQARARPVLDIGGPMEALEEPRVVLRRNADTAVLDGKADVGVHTLDSQLHGGAGR